MRILLTGAAGRIGRTYFKARRDDHEFLLTDLSTPPNVGNSAEVRTGDITDVDFVRSLVAGVDAIIHLAGTADPNTAFEDVMTLNVEPTRHLLTAAAEQNVRRFVFASSAQTIEAYPVDVQVKVGDQPRPANFYGAGKVMGEALCALYSFTHGLETVALRIGAFEDPENHHLETTRDLSAWLSPRDAVHLIDRALAADIHRPLVVNGVSNNRFKRLDIEHARLSIGYNPVDDAFAQFDIPVDQLQ